MKNEDQQEPDAEFPDEEPLSADKAAGERAALPAPDSAEKGRQGGGIAWLALFLALIAAAGTGYLVVHDWRARSGEVRAASTLADLSDRMASSGQALSGIDQQLTDLAATDARTSAELEALRTTLENRLRQLDTLPARLTSLEKSVASLQGISTDARNTLLLAEAEYYMQLANAQLQLAGNPKIAALALGMADDRIVQLADPALTEVRRALADELAALEVMEKPDIEGATLTLSSLAGVVASLPLRKAGGDNETAASDGEELSGFSRAWASVRRAAGRLVQVTPPDETALPLLTPDAEYFLRTNLTLQLQVARLALLRGEQAVFEQSLDDAESWLNTYFDTSSAQVRGARATLAEIRGSMVVVAPPDISESLRLLRQANRLAETAH